MTRIKALCIVVLVGPLLWAQAPQHDGVLELDEVVVADSRLFRFSLGNPIDPISDSIVSRDGAVLTNLLRYHSGIYFRENGRGMVASPSFRGTSAAHTAVVWNGININSQLTGQTDFNTIIARNYGSVFVRRGGGSVLYGSGAIGGSVHLMDRFDFEPHLDQDAILAYGGFQDRNLGYRLSTGDQRMTFGVGVEYRGSDNNYRDPGSDWVNRNGGFNNLDFNAHWGSFLARNQLLKFFSHSYIGDRELSGTLTAPSKALYKDRNWRNMLEWAIFHDQGRSTMRLAQLHEEFRYFPDRDALINNEGRSDEFLWNYGYTVRWRTIMWNTLIEYRRTTADGDALGRESRNTFSFSMAMRQQLSDRLSYGASLRKDWVDQFDSPLVYSLDGTFVPSKSYTLSWGLSRNYRIPTFNDLYWTGAGSSGNPDLEPESAYQIQIGQKVRFHQLGFRANGYVISSRNLIQWRPMEAAIWIPVNIGRALNYGLEIEAELIQEWRGNRVVFTPGYTYTRARDSDNHVTLIYVPTHRFTADLGYGLGGWTVYVQALYNGPVFTTSDNSERLKGYTVCNLGIQWRIPLAERKNLELGLRLENLFNKAYQNVAYRPMPNRNLMCQAHLRL